MYQSVSQSINRSVYRPFSCLNSSNSIVRFVAGQGVLHQRMHSPIGRNDQHSATLLGTPLSKLASINKKMAWTTVNNRVLSDSVFSNMNVIRELLYIKHNFADMTLYSKDEIDFILEYCCRLQARFYFIFYVFIVFMFVYEVHNK